MRYLLDTNILVRWADTSSPAHPLVTASLVSLHRQSADLYVARQNIIEFWAVATRPVNSNGLDWTIDETRREINRATSFVNLLPSNDDVYAIWLRLVEEDGVAGKSVHDAHLAATAISNNITRVLTINTDDFKRFTEVAAIHPRDVPLVP
ncbi:MAG: type II toxin-antitoxin system VapC family toxin [Capsulimonadaceae bacterium]